MATGLEMDVIAACVVGGVSLSGGRGTVPGVFLGGLIMAIIGKALPLIGVSQFWQSAIKGLIILFAVILNVITQRTMDKNALKGREM
jgi:rhamnose transport system permease protein